MDVYICYSRQDGSFVRELSFLLGQQRVSSWVDAEGLDYGANWWSDIREGIIDSDLFLFVVSDHSLLSPFLHRELRFAREYNKQVVTLTYDGRDKVDHLAQARQVAGSKLRNELERSKQYNYLEDLTVEEAYDNYAYLSQVTDYAFTLGEHSETNVEALVVFIRAHQNQARPHTQWLHRAVEWNNSGRNPDLLLRGQELRDAISWLYSKGDDKVPPTPIHFAYINASQRHNGKTVARRWLSRLGIMRDDRVFISYRRADSQEIGRAIYDALVERFGKRTVFFDIDTIPAGVDFAEFISGVLNKCSVFLCVIGSGWVSVQEKDGSRRLDNPKDWVRLEVATALRNPDITVIPVLIGTTSMPSERQLPEPLSELRYRNAVRVHDDHQFSKDMAQLTEDVDEARRA
ncbi:MAG: TIR domain-containing protein [Anaerolineae bacterium]|nr:TIR domain-containing protein [Anaerolineae bacterium]